MYGNYATPSADVVIVKDGKVLLSKRSDKVWYPGEWCLPGGRIDGGETWLSTAEKEVLEEVCVKIKNPKLLGIYSDPERNIFDNQKTGKKDGYVVATFLVTEFEGEPSTSDEVSEVGWFDLQSLPVPLLKSDEEKIRDAFAFKGTPFVR